MSDDIITGIKRTIDGDFEDGFIEEPLTQRIELPEHLRRLLEDE